MSLVVVETDKKFEEVCRALEKAVADRQFGILHVHDLRQALSSKGIAFGQEVRVFDVCNPQRAKQVLERNVLVAAALPCAIAVIAEGEKTRIAFVRPTVMLGLFGSGELVAVAEEVEGAMRAIVDAAAG